jgi:integrase
MARRTRLPQPTRPDAGSWAVRWRSTVAGQPVRHQRTFRTRAEAEAFIRDDLAPNPGRDWKAATTPFSAYAQAWLDSCEVKPRTRQGYAEALTHALKFLGDRPVGEVTARDAREFLVTLKATPTLRTPRSIRWAWWPFRAVMGLAVVDEAISANPADAVKKFPTMQNYRGKDGQPLEPFHPRYLSEDQVDRIAEAFASRPPYGLMVRFLAWTGLRTGELAGLDVADVHLWTGKAGWRGYVDVHRTRRKVKGVWLVDTPKSRRSTRHVKLADWLAKGLHEYLTTVHPRGTEPDAPLFPNRHRGGYTHGQHSAGSIAQGALNWNEPVEPGAFHRNLFKPSCSAASLKPLRLHDLRHTYASISLARGMDIRVLSEQMGHSSYSFTLDTYGGLVPADDDKASPLDARPLAATKAAR